VIHVVHLIVTITCGAKENGACSKYNNVNVMCIICNQKTEGV
jgi:hypothetical protein